MEMTVLQEEVFTPRFLETSESSRDTQGHTGKHPAQSEGKGSKGKMWARAFVVVSVGKVRQGRGSRLRFG